MSDNEEMMRSTLSLDHDQNLIVFAYVTKRPVSGVPKEFEYFYSIMVDTSDENPNSVACSIEGSPIYSTYDDAVLAMNDNLSKKIKERYDV